MRSKCMQEMSRHHFYLNTAYVGELCKELMKNIMNIII